MASATWYVMMNRLVVEVRCFSGFEVSGCTAPPLSAVSGLGNYQYIRYLAGAATGGDTLHFPRREMESVPSEAPAAVLAEGRVDVVALAGALGAAL
jgi:hypothetical protein